MESFKQWSDLAVFRKMMTLAVLVGDWAGVPARWPRSWQEMESGQGLERHEADEGDMRLVDCPWDMQRRERPAQFVDKGSDSLIFIHLTPLVWKSEWREGK